MPSLKFAFRIEENVLNISSPMRETCDFFRSQIPRRAHVRYHVSQFSSRIYFYEIVQLSIFLSRNLFLLCQTCKSNIFQGFKADCSTYSVVLRHFLEISNINCKLKRSRVKHGVRRRQKTFTTRGLGYNSLLLRCLHSCWPLGMYSQQPLVFVSVTVLLIGSSTSYRTPEQSLFICSRGSRWYFTPEV